MYYTFASEQGRGTTITKKNNKNKIVDDIPLEDRLWVFLV